MADSPVLYVYYRPDNDDAYPGVPNRHITEADWARFSPSQRRTVEQATTQEGYTRRKVWVHRDLVDETEQERADREAAEQAAREAYERGQSIVRWRDFESLVPGPGEVIVGSEDGPVRKPVTEIGGSGPVQRGPNTIVLGDSITAGNTVGSGASRGGGGNSYATLAEIISNGRIRILRNSGVSGDTTAQMLARVEADVIAYRPDRCIVMGGTNDMATVELPQILANLTAIWDRLITEGILPIVGLVCPRPNYQDKVSLLNAAIRQEAIKRGLSVLDTHTVLVDPATGAYRDGWSDDGIHPNRIGARVLAEYVVAELGGTYPMAGPMLTSHVNDQANLITNGLFLTDSDGNGLADNWLFNGSGSSVTPSIEEADAIPGNWQVATQTAAGQRYLVQLVTTGWAPGDLVEFSGRLRTEGLEAGRMPITIRINNSSNANTFAYAAFNLESDVEGVFRCRGVIPAGTTDVRPMMLTGTTGTGIVKVAQLTLVNLTALGVA